MRRGPLRTLRVLEIPNIGPLQHAGMMLADLGAEVLRLERKAHVDGGKGRQGPTRRSRSSTVAGGAPAS